MSKENTRADILTKSGQYFDFLNPERYRLEITDIAHALSNVCRFAGHCRTFYSVAQHCVYVSRIVPEEDAFAGLMHDCAEAFIGDVARPLKLILPDYKIIERRVETALFAALGLPAKLPASVKLADRQMLFSEQAALLPPHDDEWSILEGIDPPPGVIVTPLCPDEAYAAFMERYCELRSCSGSRGSPSLNCLHESDYLDWQLQAIVCEDCGAGLEDLSELPPAQETTPADPWPKCPTCEQPIYANHECVGVKPAHTAEL